jgi:hypothetical protein
MGGGTVATARSCERRTVASAEAFYVIHDGSAPRAG